MNEWTGDRVKVLGSAVLAIEAIIVLLAIPVAATNGSVANPGLAIGIGVGLAVILLLGWAPCAAPGAWAWVGSCRLPFWPRGYLFHLCSSWVPSS